MNAIELSRYYRELLHCGALVRVHEGEKGPFDAAWQRDSKLYVDEWEQRLEGWPAHLLFLPCGELVDVAGWLLVLDADLYKEGAEDSLAMLYALGLPRRTVTSITPSGGEHLYYVVHEPIPSRPLPGFVGIDIKCVGGGVRVYEWEYSYSPDVHAVAVIDAEPLLALLRGDLRSVPSGALEDRKPVLVDELALAVLVEHAGGHGAHWTGRGYSITRPGKDRGVSATVGVIYPGGVHVFTGAWPNVPSGSYTLHELCRLLGVPDPMIERFRAMAERIRKYAGPAIGAHVVRLADVEREVVRWLWAWRIPRGRLTMLEGDPSIGKSTLALSIAATVTRGSLFPDGQGAPIGNVLVLTAEDALGDTVRPRLEAAGADLERVYALSGEWIPDGDDERRLIEISLPAHVAMLEAQVRELDIALVIVDVLAAYTRIRGDVYRDSDMRAGIMAPLAQLAERTGAALVLIRHLTKAHGANALYAGGGSIAVTGAARSMLLAALHPETEGLRVLAHAKSNLSPLAPSLGYVLEPAEGFECARVVWKGEIELGANALLSGPPAGAEDEGPSKLEEAKTFLRDALGAGPIQSSALSKLAEYSGLDVSAKTIKRARRELGVHARQEGRHWYVELGESEGQAESGGQR